MADAKLTATTRIEFGKGAARRLRRAGQTPAVVYGHGIEPMHLALNAHETFLALRTANALLEIAVEGEAKPILALPKQITRDPILPAIEHLDLILVKAGEKVTVDVPVHLEGESYSGTIAMLDDQTISLEVEATHIPERVVVDIEGLTEGVHITAKDLVLPTGATLLSDPDLLIVGITHPQAASAADQEADAALAAEGAAQSAAAAAAAEDAE